MLVDVMTPAACPKCGEKLTFGATLCTACGCRLPNADPKQTSSASPRRRREIPVLPPRAVAVVLTLQALLPIAVAPEVTRMPVYLVTVAIAVAVSVGVWRSMRAGVYAGVALVGIQSFPLCLPYLASVFNLGWAFGFGASFEPESWDIRLMFFHSLGFRCDFVFLFDHPALAEHFTKSPSAYFMLLNVPAAVLLVSLIKRLKQMRSPAPYQPPAQ